MTNFSFWHLFGSASFFVQLIIIGLFATSIYSWGLIFSKVKQILSQIKHLRHFETTFWKTGSLETTYKRVKGQPETLLTSILSACMLEWERARTTMSLTSSHNIESFRERLDCIMTSKRSEFAQQLERGLLFLATLGSTAPFVGLLGTVLGIMNSFKAIAANQDASLVSVAPGISEALFTTALGLAVAIPSIVAYNVFSRYLSYFLERADIFCDDFNIILLRQLHERNG